MKEFGESRLDDRVTRRLAQVRETKVLTSDESKGSGKYAPRKKKRREYLWVRIHAKHLCRRVENRIKLESSRRNTEGKRGMTSS